MSAMPSWKAITSRLVGSLKRLRSRSTIACVVSWAMMSCERHVKTVWPGRLGPGFSESAVK